MRTLNDRFVADLKNGILSPLLAVVKCDDTLCLEIRSNEICVYYRGGSLFRVGQKNDDYIFRFDTKYILPDNPFWEPADLSKLAAPQEHVASIPLLKREMDYWFHKHQKSEREYQQVILRENNLSNISSDTDYYISDIEYADPGNNSRFDMVGIKWLSTSPSRKNRSSPSLALFEVKYGDGAMTGSAGIVKHFTDIQTFINSGKLDGLIEEVQGQFNQKIELGLVRDLTNPICIDKSARPEFILICANHKPASSVLERELKLAFNACPRLSESINIRLAGSSITGYGMYESKMIPLPCDGPF